MTEGIADEYLRLVLSGSPDDPVRKRNALTRKIVEEIRKLRSSDEGQRALTALLNHPNQDVRLDAAVSSLDWAPDKAIPVLEEIEQGPGLNSVSAKYALIDYRKSGRSNWVTPMLGKRRLPITQAGYESAVAAHKRVSAMGLASAWNQDPGSFTAASSTFRVLHRMDVSLIFAEAEELLLRQDRRELNQAEAHRLEELEHKYKRLRDPQASLDRVTLSQP